jgi:hypothetical protein
MGTPTTTCERRRKEFGSAGKDTGGSPLKSTPNISRQGGVGNLELQYSSFDTLLPASHADWSFDPWEEDTAILTNRELVDAILFTEDWLGANGVIQLDYSAYQVRQKRLESERQSRIALGHLWLKSVHERKSFKLYQTVEGANGAFDVVSVENDELVYGPVRDISDRPIMTQAQFHGFIAAKGIPTVGFADYQAQMASSSPANPLPSFEFSDAGASPIRGLSGGVSQSNFRANMLQRPFSMRNAVARQGAIGEAYLGSSREAGFGLLVRDYNAIPWTHPFRGTETGNYPLVDYRKAFGGDPRPEWSAKTRTVSNVNPFIQFDTYLTGMAQMMNTLPGYRGFTHYMNNAGGGRTPQAVRDQLSLRINADDVPAFQRFVSDPFARETTPGGQPSRMLNYQRAAMSRIYDGVLQDRPFTLQDGSSFNTVAALDTALRNNTINAAQHRQALIDVGQRAAGKVAAIPDLTTSTLQTFGNVRGAVPNRMTPRDVRAAVSPEYMLSLTRGGGWRGDWHAAKSYGGKGAALGGGIGMLREGFDMLTDEKANPDAFERLARAGGRESLRGGLTSGVESLAASRSSQYILSRGLSAYSGRALATRLGARAVPGGVVDMGFEGYDMLTDDRPNRPREVGYRMTRALVIGGASALAGATAGAWAGAAIGTAVFPGVGTVIGFVVGVLVGALVGFIVSSIIPNYEQMVMEQVPLKEFEKNIDQQMPSSIENQVLADQEMKLMAQVAAGPEWRGPHHMRDMYQRRNLSNLPGDRMYMESMIAGDIHGGCQECHTRKAGVDFNMQFDPDSPAFLSPVDRMYLAAMDEDISGGGRGRFLDWDVPGQTVDPRIARQMADDPTALSIMQSINAIQPNLGEWESIMGPKGEGLIPRHVMNSPKGPQALKDAIKSNIDSRQWYFELFFNEVGEDEYKLYRANLKKAEEEQKKKNAK